MFIRISWENFGMYAIHFDFSIKKNLRILGRTIYLTICFHQSLYSITSRFAPHPSYTPMYIHAKANNDTNS